MCLLNGESFNLELACYIKIHQSLRLVDDCFGDSTIQYIGDYNILPSGKLT